MAGRKDLGGTVWLCVDAQRVIRCCPGNTELEGEEWEPTDSSWEEIAWMLQHKMPGYLTRMAECLQKENREPVMENLLLFDELAPDHARRTVVFTVRKICARHSGELQAVRISLPRNELLHGVVCLISHFSYYRDDLVPMAW